MTRLRLIAVGKCRDDAILALIQRYRSRMSQPFELTETTASTHKNPKTAMAEEARSLLAAAKGCSSIVALDERGRGMTSQSFAGWLAQQIDATRTPIAFLIGGAAGLDPAIHRQAHLTLNLGKLTWPHMLVRVLLAEQLYRAETIRTGHPYHRG